MDLERSIRDFKAATKMIYEEAGAADEESFEIGKRIGVHLAVSHCDSTSCLGLMMCAGGIEGLS
jgi:hypothetical protein